MYAVTSILLVSLTRAIFRRAELGFFGVVVLTTVQTPLLWGQFSRAGELDLYTTARRAFLISWLIVGTTNTFPNLVSLMHTAKVPPTTPVENLC